MMDLGEVVIGGNVPYPVIHISQPGQSADSPAADFELGREGTFPTAGHALSWLSPFALRQVLSHVKDAMLNGQIAAADRVLADYQTLLASYPSFPEWQEVAVEWRTEFAALLLEIQSLRQSIVRHPASVGSAITLTGCAPLAPALPDTSVDTDTGGSALLIGLGLVGLLGAVSISARRRQSAA